jgi:hypothetical protein
MTSVPSGLLDQLLEKLAVLPDAALRDIAQQAQQSNSDITWVPNPGPQTDAYFSLADIMLYGGQAGGGKTHLELGVAINTADAGIIFRRELTQTDGLEKEGKAIIGRAAGYNGTDHEWLWPNGKSLKLAGMRDPDSWQDHAGRERDYMGFDEGGEFLEKQVASILAWLRAAPGKRTRVVIASNPPRTTDGLWLLKWFAPWLDDKFPNPAMPGELRWAVRVSRAEEVNIIWVEGPGEYEVEGEKYSAQSYTFIPASLEDNPYRNTPEYRAQLQALPEPLRSQLLYGKFAASFKDLENQCIPSDWVRAAQARWKPEKPEGVPMCAIGTDCAGGGDDYMVQAARYDGWYAPLVKTPGREIPQDRAGAFAAGLVLSTRRDRALVVVDMGGGYGGPLFEHLKANDIECVAYKGAEGTIRRTADGKLGFTNKRSAAYWFFREALDPGQPGGSPIALPPDRRLLAGLCAPTFKVTPQGIQVEPKVVRNEKGRVTGGVLAKLGWSPDEADAVVMAWFEGARALTEGADWLDLETVRGSLRKRVNVITSGRTPLSARRVNR